MIADVVSALQEQMLSLFCEMLVVWEEQQLVGGTVVALEGLRRSANASQEWRGTLRELQPPQEKLEAKSAQGLAEHQQGDGRERRSDSQQAPWPPESHDAPPQDAAPQAAERRAGEPPSRRGTTRRSSLRQAKSTGQKWTRTGRKRPRPPRPPQKRGSRRQRLRRQADRLTTWPATPAPKIGRQGPEIQSDRPDNASAKMLTAPGVGQGYPAQARVADQAQGIGAADVFGAGQDAPHLSLSMARARAPMPALGHGEDVVKGTTGLADSQDPREADLKTGETEYLAASIPDMNFRQREPRVAKQGQHTPKKQPSKKTFPVEDVQSDVATDRYRCPTGKGLRLRAREQPLRNGVYRWYGAQEEDGRACLRRAPGLSPTRTKRRHRSIPVAQASQPLPRAQQLITKIAPVEGRKQSRWRVEMVEPVWRNIRTQKRLDHVTLRGTQQVDSPWRRYARGHNLEKIAPSGEAG